MLWYLVCALVGGSLGFLGAAILASSKRADECARCMFCNMRCPERTVDQ